MLLALRARRDSCGLTLHEDKTRLIQFGRFAALSRQRRGARPATFAFLGFPHSCGRTRDGRFIVKHKTEGKRLTRKPTALRRGAWRLKHAPMAIQHERFTGVLRGDYGLSSAPRLLFGNCVGSGCVVSDDAARKTGAWAGRSSTRTARFRLLTPRITRTWALSR
jgi:RNA-directed DNA polymerase